MNKHLHKFWNWYEKHYTFNISITALLLVWQVVHLYWLAADVVAARIFDKSYFPASDFWRYLIIMVDYAEIPAIVSASLLYINELRKKFALKNLLFLLFLNIQWIHLFWITDEFVVSRLTKGSEFIAWSIWLTWFAIIIDYLETPVIYDTVRRFFISFKSR